jgi:ParB-like chromosome segregation protein Spo0J
MEIKTMRLVDLMHASYNPRKELKPGDPEYDKLRCSIQSFGYVEPIIWNTQTKQVVGGHQRLNVLLDLGIEEESVVIVDLAPNDEKALNVALNKVSGEWDMAKLKDILEELDTGAYDVSLTGFDSAEIESIMKKYHIPGGDEATQPTNNNDFNYKEQYGVIIICTDEHEQQEIYERLAEEGYTCRIVAT